MIVRRHFWILLFALLLPLAQTAAAAHEVSHVESSLETGTKSGLQGGHCDLCALAAQIGGGAAASSPAKLQLPELVHVAPRGQLDDQTTTAVITGFDSRAPPTSLLA